MICMTTLCALLDISGTTVTLGPADIPQADAQVTMDNALTNGAHDDATYTLLWDDMVVQVTFQWDAGPYGADLLTVIPPDGMICEPLDCTMLVNEMHRGIVYLLPWSGM